VLIHQGAPVRSVLAGVVFALGACPELVAAQRPVERPPNSAPQVAAVAGADYEIGPGDVLGVVFWRDPEISGDAVVRPDGKITVPVIGEVHAAGLRPDELQKALTVAAGKFIVEPNVAVVVRTINSRQVFVTGQVANPGAHPLVGPVTVMQALALAGGLTEYADAKNITVLRNSNGDATTFKFNYRDVSKGKNLAQNIKLMPGDTIVVP
jgi:polysaccharide biosynthesis/export protein